MKNVLFLFLVIAAVQVTFSQTQVGQFENRPILASKVESDSTIFVNPDGNNFDVFYISWEGDVFFERLLMVDKTGNPRGDLYTATGFRDHRDSTVFLAIAESNMDGYNFRLEFTSMDGKSIPVFTGFNGGEYLAGNGNQFFFFAPAGYNAWKVILDFSGNEPKAVTRPLGKVRSEGNRLPSSVFRSWFNERIGNEVEPPVSLSQAGAWNNDEFTPEIITFEIIGDSLVVLYSDYTTINFELSQLTTLRENYSLFKNSYLENWGRK